MKQINFKKLASKFSEKVSRDPLKFEITPYKTWRIIVVCFLGAFLASALFGAYLFFGVRNENLFNSEEKKDAGIVLNIVKLSEVTKKFEDKERTLQELKENKTVRVDPSL